MKFYFVHFEHLKELQRDLFKFNQLCIATPTLYRHMVGLLNKWIHTFCFMMAAPVTALSTMSIGRHLMRLQLFQGISFMNHTLWWSDFERRIKGIQGAPWQASVILLCGYHSPARDCFICNAALCTNGASFDCRFKSKNVTSSTGF